MDDAALSAALVAAVRQLFKGPNRDQLSVNNVRKQVEEEHGLDSGFFAGPEWKSRSKTLIKETVVCYSILSFKMYILALQGLDGGKKLIIVSFFSPCL